mgnify:FL=1
MRLAGAVGRALKLAGGTLLGAPEGGEELSFSQAFACPVHGVSMDEPQPRDFSCNSPYGACPECTGLGSRLEPDPDLIVPDMSRSLAEGAIKPFSGGMKYYPQLVAALAKHFGVSEDAAWQDLPKNVRDAFLYGLGDERIRIDYTTRDGRETHRCSRYAGAGTSGARRYAENE